MTPVTRTYTRKDVVTMLTALPMEEKRWTLDYLINIMLVPTATKTPKNEVDVFADFRGLPCDNTPDDVIREQMYTEKYGF